MKILFLHTQNNGCGYYRVWVPEKWVKRLPGVETMRAPNKLPKFHWFKDQQPEDHLWPSMEELYRWADLIYIMRLETLQQVTFHCRMAQELGKKMVMDTDDDIFNVSKDNPVYNIINVDIEDTVQINTKPLTEGCVPVPVMHKGKKMWANQVRNDYLYFGKRQLSMSDHVTVSVPRLKRLYKNYNPRVSVVPNALDFEDFAETPKRNDGTVRIGWAGGHAHYDDLHSIWDVLVAICDKYPQARFVFCGTKFDFLYKLPEKQLEIQDFVDISGWPEKFRSMQFDIGIAPLTGALFNQGKSNIKWLENGSQRTPTVVSPVEPFLNVVDGQTGLVARSKEDWFKALSRLIESAPLRKRIGDRAYDEVNLKFNAETMARRWYSVFEEVLK